MRNSNTISKNTKKKYTFQSNSGVNVLYGVYRGYVIDNKDDRRMGRVCVQISGTYSSFKHSDDLTPEKFTGAVWCRVMSPVGGTTQIDTANSQQSYGIVFPPPDINTEVMVAFTGDIDKGVVIGCLIDDSRNSTLAGPQAGLVNDKYSQIKEEPKTRQDINSTPTEHAQSHFLRLQGLIQDLLRGLNFSNPRRDEKNAVVGISSPQGHSLIFDDGNSEKKNQLIRLRTANGSQILMEDTCGFVYIINRDGTSWVEMDADGNLHVYAKKSINMATEGDFNIHSAGSVNIESTKSVNIKAPNIKMEASTGNTDIHSATTTNVYGGVNINLHAVGNLVQTASRVDLCGPIADIAAKPVIVELPKNQKVLQSICRTVPEHEPWNVHKDVLYIRKDKVNV